MTKDNVYSRCDKYITEVHGYHNNCSPMNKSDVIKY